MGQTGFCKNLRFPEVFCDNLQFSAKGLRLQNAVIPRKSRKISKNQRKSAKQKKTLALSVPFSLSLLIPLERRPTMFRRNLKGWFPKGWFWRMFPRNENRNEGTFACSPGQKTGTRVCSHVPPERKPERG